MRREDIEIKDIKIIENILAKALVGRIGLTHNNEPYIVPVNFGYKENTIYFHSATEGKKINLLKKNNSVCFQTEVDHELIKDKVACRWSAKYLSIIAFGKAYFIDDLQERIAAFDVKMKHYLPDEKYEYTEGNLNNTAVSKILIEEITGKNSGY